MITTSLSYWHDFYLISELDIIIGSMKVSRLVHGIAEGGIVVGYSDAGSGLYCQVHSIQP